MRAVKQSSLKGGGIGLGSETCVNGDGPAAMVPCLHQGNIYMKRKLRRWSDQKCIPLVGAETALTCAGRQTTQSHVSQYRAENGNFRKFGSTFRHGTVFAPKQYLHQKEATGMESLKMHSLDGAKTELTCAGPSNNPVSREAV